MSRSWRYPITFLRLGTRVMAKRSTTNLSDERIAELLSGRKAPVSRRDQRREKALRPSPRLPEALWYYLFILGETAIFLGVWGQLRGGDARPGGAPAFEAPVLEQLRHHLIALGQGLTSVLADLPWVPLLIAAMAAAVFLPGTSRSRRRVATILSSAVALVFVLLIVMGFMDQLSDAARLGPL
jgi:hypothetical protein